MSSKKEEIVWRQSNDDDWDDLVASMEGHPLQTTVWGNARELVDGINQLKLIALKNEVILGLARIEIRRLRLLGGIGWMPRGPVISQLANRTELTASLRLELKKRGLAVCASSPWIVDVSENSYQQTIQIDLTVGESSLFTKLDSQFRYGVRKSRKVGVVVRLSQERQEIERFFKLCEDISRMKTFDLPGSKELLLELISSSPSDAVEVGFFVADLGGNLAGGAVVIRCGKNAHYLWGAVDRNYSKFRAGEAVQWAVIEWALASGCDMYDLEGIDPVRNPGTYRFKKKMGGRIVGIVRPELFGTSWLGRLAAPALRKKI